MTTTTHASFVIERLYSASPKRVFAAWSDPVAKRAWFVEGEGWDIQSYEIDFREGGSEKSIYGFRRGEEVFGEKTAFTNETVFNEIIENERIVFTYSMARNGARFSVSLATVEIAAPGSPAANPGFDVTPARLVTGLITERGVAWPHGLGELFPEEAKAAGRS